MQVMKFLTEFKSGNRDGGDLFYRKRLHAFSKMLSPYACYLNEQ